MIHGDTGSGGERATKETLKKEIDELFAVYTATDGPSVMRPLVFGIKRFVNYILASNGKISDDEAELLGEVLDRKIAPQELADYITAENVYSREYAQAIPASGSGSARKSFSRITPRRNCWTLLVGRILPTPGRSGISSGRRWLARRTGATEKRACPTRTCAGWKKAISSTRNG